MADGSWAVVAADYPAAVRESRRILRRSAASPESSSARPPCGARCCSGGLSPSSAAAASFPEVCSDEEFHERYALAREGARLDTWFSSALWPLVALGWQGQDHAPRHTPTPHSRQGKQVEGAGGGS
eukprot:GHVT01087085.1.p1 GENE.GHVT01087085.1~~GHVT01087085.1.p1  ORF type:complete len:126 (-),score=37.98 GHVT01087085.1:231-608(-)